MKPKSILHLALEAKRAQQTHRVAPGTKGAAQLMARHSASKIVAAAFAHVGESAQARAARVEREAHNARVEYERQLRKAVKRSGTPAQILDGMVAGAVAQIERDVIDKITGGNAWKGSASPASQPSSSPSSSSPTIEPPPAKTT